MIEFRRVTFNKNSQGDITGYKVSLPPSIYKLLGNPEHIKFEINENGNIEIEKG